MSTAPSAPNSSHRTPTAPLVSPVSARHEPSRQPTAPPVAERPGPPPFNPYSSPARPSASLHRQTSQTWKEATSTPISTESYRPVPSSLRTKSSQSSFHSISSSNSGVRAEATWAPELTDEPEEEEEFERAVPIPSSARSRDPASISENPIATSPPAAREFWTPTITPEEDAQASRFGRERGGSGLRSSLSLKRKPMPSSFVEAPAPSTAPLDVRKHAEREAAERQEMERSWKNLEQSREKEKSVGRVGGARLSTASEQVHRQNEHVSGGSTSYPDGPATFTRPADSSSNAKPFPSPNAAPSPRTVDPPETFPTSGSYRSLSHLSQGSIPNGISAAYFPNVPPSSLEDSTEEEDENESSSYSSYSSEPMSNPAPTSISAFPIGGDSRSTPYSYTPSKSAAVPIPARQRIPEDDPDPLLPQSPGEYSRWGTPQRGASSFSESLRGASSFSSRDNAFEAEREQERLRVERERAREEREREQRVQEAERKAKEVAEEAQRKAEEIQRKAEELQRQQEETEKKLREISEREANLREREAEMRRKEEETRQKELAKQREEAARKKEEAARQREEAARQREEAAARQREDAARQREEAERQRKEKEKRQAEEAARQREESERQKKENEKRQAEEVARQREEAERQRKERERRQAEAEKHRKEVERQFQFEQQAAEIKRKAEERKRQGSMDSENTWSSYSSWGTPPRAAPASPSPSNTTSSSTRSNTTGSSSAGNWSSSAGTSQASSGGARTSSTGTPNGKPTWTGTSTTPRASTQPNPGSANSEDWARRQREQAEEQFRKMQEQLERERQAKEQKAGRILSKEDVVRIYQLHEQQWAKMSSHTEVTWDMLPWPMYKKPNSAEEITSGAVDAYIMSPNYPEPEKSTKDRVRQHLRRWHEDHFNQKVLVKVGEADKERVKAAAGTVTRNLNNLLERTNESKKAGSGVFG
ncbi:hypothetical protein B0H14DRAFT_3892454 [Mycena olivaceomarginata]|nr:hypothetical protein B0H14DRAFT_3892454 [Mycena olivaceomarginata]